MTQDFVSLFQSAAKIKRTSLFWHLDVQWLNSNVKSLSNMANLLINWTQTAATLPTVRWLTWQARAIWPTRRQTVTVSPTANWMLWIVWRHKAGNVAIRHGNCPLNNAEISVVGGTADIATLNGCCWIYWNDHWPISAPCGRHVVTLLPSPPCVWLVRADKMLFTG